MKYMIEPEAGLNEALIKNAKLKSVSVPELITEILKRYVIDAHIMESSELWENGIKECADIELDWANL